MGPWGAEVGPICSIPCPGGQSGGGPSPCTVRSGHEGSLDQSSTVQVQPVLALSSSGSAWNHLERRSQSSPRIHLDTRDEAYLKFSLVVTLVSQGLREATVGASCRFAPDLTTSTACALSHFEMVSFTDQAQSRGNTHKHAALTALERDAKERTSTCPACCAESLQQCLIHQNDDRPGFEQCPEGRNNRWANCWRCGLLLPHSSERGLTSNTRPLSSSERLVVQQPLRHSTSELCILQHREDPGLTSSPRTNQGTKLVSSACLCCTESLQQCRFAVDGWILVVAPG